MKVSKQRHSQPHGLVDNSCNCLAQDECIMNGSSNYLSTALLFMVSLVQCPKSVDPGIQINYSHCASKHIWVLTRKTCFHGWERPISGKQINHQAVRKSCQLQGTQTKLKLRKTTPCSQPTQAWHGLSFISCGKFHLHVNMCQPHSSWDAFFRSAKASSLLVLTPWNFKMANGTISIDKKDYTYVKPWTSAVAASGKK